MMQVPEPSRSVFSAADSAGRRLPGRKAAIDTLRLIETECKTLLESRTIVSKSAWNLIAVETWVP
jgi:hypothetical protein